MSPDHAVYAEWDAAYVLGALTATDRRAFEAHLEECERCRLAVAELASLPGLLAVARPLVDGPGGASGAPGALGMPGLPGTLGLPDAAAEPPIDLFERVQAREDHRRRTVRRRIALSVVGAAAAVALAIGIPAALTGPATEATTVTLAAVVDTSLTASVALEQVAWGTSISMECDYPAGGLYSGTAGQNTYSLVVTDDAGHASQVSTWTAVPGKTIHLDAASAVALDHIASIEIRSAAGDTILTAPVGA